MGTIDAMNIRQDTANQKAGAMLGSVTTLLAAVLRGIAAYYVKRRSRARLLDLTDDQLRDVGLTHGDVRRELAKSFFWD